MKDAGAELSLLCESTMKGAIEGGATRHVAAAVAAALVRTAHVVLHEEGKQSTACSQQSESCNSVEQQVESRLKLIKPAIQAQCKAGVEQGVNYHSARPLISERAKLLSNCAKHSGFNDNVSFEELSNAELKRRQHGSRQKRHKKKCPSDDETHIDGSLSDMLSKLGSLLHADPGTPRSSLNPDAEAYIPGFASEENQSKGVDDGIAQRLQEVYVPDYVDQWTVAEPVEPKGPDVSCASVQYPDDEVPRKERC